ncbi:MAG: hypothetical protein NC489_36495 [Ruminococcus flavefaciens]|nr:hypothetical protein [Ruminococcus flavefaciens]
MQNFGCTKPEKSKQNLLISQEIRRFLACYYENTISEKRCGTTGLDFFSQMRHDFGWFGKATPEVIAMEKKQIPQPDPNRIERPIPPKIYPVVDSDLARDNVENDLPAADLQELQ